MRLSDPRESVKLYKMIGPGGELEYHRDNERAVAVGRIFDLRATTPLDRSRARMDLNDVGLYRRI